MLAQRLPPGALHQYAPLDSPLFVRRFVKHWRPDAALVAESELWPNMIVELKRAGLAARDGQRADQRAVVRRWLKAPRFIGALLGNDFDLCLARSESDGERLAALGAPSVLVAGDIKFDAPTLPADRRELAELAGLTSGRQIWIAASTHEGEETIAAEAHRRLRQVFPDALTLIAPRHPDRGEAILRQLEAQGLVCALRSRGDPVGPGTAVYVCDTIGELGLFYRLAGVVFVGKSFVGGGGQNPIEPAKLACAILHGPMVANFADAYAALDDAGGALAVARPEDLGESADRALRRCGAPQGDGARGRPIRWSAGPAPSSARCARSKPCCRPPGRRGEGAGLLGEAEADPACARASADRRALRAGDRAAHAAARANAPTRRRFASAISSPAAPARRRPRSRLRGCWSQTAGASPSCRAATAAPNASSRSSSTPNAHTAAIVGDEPLLLARIAPCWVGADRVRSAKSAVEAGANALVLDDGLQNPALVKDLAFAVVDGETGFGNGLMRSRRTAAGAGFGSAAVRAGADRDRRRRGRRCRRSPPPRRASPSSARASNPTRSPRRR